MPRFFLEVETTYTPEFTTNGWKGPKMMGLLGRKEKVGSGFEYGHFVGIYK